MKNSLNSIVRYNFQNFTHMTSYNTIITLFSPTPVMPLLPSLSPLVTSSLFSVSVSLFLFYYIHLFAYMIFGLILLMVSHHTWIVFWFLWAYFLLLPSLNHIVPAIVMPHKISHPQILWVLPFNDLNHQKKTQMFCHMGLRLIFPIPHFSLFTSFYVCLAGCVQ